MQARYCEQTMNGFGLRGLRLPRGLGTMDFTDDAGANAITGDPTGTDAEFAKTFGGDQSTTDASGNAFSTETTLDAQTTTVTPGYTQDPRTESYDPQYHPNPPPEKVGGGSMWTSLFSNIFGGNKGGASSFDAQIAQMAGSQAAAEAARTRNMILGLVVGVVGFGGVVYLLSKK